MALIMILLMILYNYEFVFMFTKKKNNDMDDDNDETTNEQILKRVEISTGYERKKKKKYKTIEIHVVKEEKVVFSIVNLIYMHFDLYFNYILICLIYFLMIDQEKNYLVLALYIFILCILILRILFIVNEFKNDYEYLIAFSISFFISIRIITISRGYTLIYLFSCIYLLILILSYILVDRRKILVTLMLLFHLYSACLYLNSNYIFVLIILLIALPFSIGNDDRKYNCSFCGIFLPVCIILFFQLYGFKNIYNYMMDFKDNINSVLMFDVFGLAQNIIHGSYINEFDIMQNLNEFFAYNFGNKKDKSF
jgi:hypothetical protein